MGKSWSTIGLFPKEYNPRVHGPYVPSRYYGKADTKLLDVKLHEVIPWLSRRSYHPVAMARAISRASWMHRMKYVHVRKQNLAFAFQACALYCTVSFCFFVFQHNYKRRKYH